MAVNRINSDATGAPTGLLKDRQAIISGGFGLSSRPSLRCMALRAERLAAFRAERPVFREIGFAISAGGALLLLGPNGSGKSTLLRLLAGLKQPDAGTITWYGKNIATDPRAHAARVAYVGHLDAVKPGLTAAENLACDARLGGGNTEVALAALDIAPLAALPARMLSAGQRRRLALARLALIPAPLWLLDEPTTGLDAAAIDKFGAILAAHRAGGGVIVAATHVALPVPGAAELRLG